MTAHPIWVPRLFAEGAARSVVRSNKVGWIYPHSSNNSRQSHRATRCQKQNLFRLINLQNSSKMKKQPHRRRPREIEFSGTKQRASATQKTKPGQWNFLTGVPLGFLEIKWSANATHVYILLHIPFRLLVPSCIGVCLQKPSPTPQTLPISLTDAPGFHI